MKSLYLIRHAKSSWEEPVIDKERGLTDKGITNIKKVGIATKCFLPSDFTIWSSTATRAYTTAQLYCEYASLNRESILLKDSLYTFDVNTLIAIIKNCEDSINHLMVFGHNNAFTDFVNKYGNSKIENVPTAGFVHLEFDTNTWSSLRKGFLKQFIIPKEL